MGFAERYMTADAVGRRQMRDRLLDKCPKSGRTKCTSGYIALCLMDISAHYGAELVATAVRFYRKRVKITHEHDAYVQRVARWFFSKFETVDEEQGPVSPYVGDVYVCPASCRACAMADHARGGGGGAEQTLRRSSFFKCYSLRSDRLGHMLNAKLWRHEGVRFVVEREPSVPPPPQLSDSESDGNLTDPASPPPQQQRKRVRHQNEWKATLGPKRTRTM